MKSYARTMGNISLADIETLRAAICEGASWDTYDVAVCDLAADGRVDPDCYCDLTQAQARHLRSMERTEAIALCVQWWNERAKEQP